MGLQMHLLHCWLSIEERGRRGELFYTKPMSMAASLPLQYLYTDEKLEG
jgi:hypothetical protein